MSDRPPLLRRAILLAWVTIGYNLVEGLVSVYFGLADDALALAGFGADSFIEVGSAAIVLWRFRAAGGDGPALPRERAATAAIGALFLLLAAGAGAAALFALARAGRPESTAPGVLVSAASLGFMAWLWRAKRALALRLDSAALRKDADCSLACIQLSLVLLAGSAAFWASPALWWADSAAALGLSALIGREGWKTVAAARSPGFAGGCACAP